jgi:hypothetical protein
MTDLCSRVALILVLSVLVLPSASIAADTDGAFRTIGLQKETSCASYLSARDEGRKGDYHRENTYLNWVLGYLTAYNRIKPNTYDVKGSSDVSALMLWLENFCKTTQLYSFGDAVDELTTKLYPERIKVAPN